MIFVGHCSDPKYLTSLMFEYLEYDTFICDMSHYDVAVTCPMYYKYSAGH